LKNCLARDYFSEESDSQLIISLIDKVSQRKSISDWVWTENIIKLQMRKSTKSNRFIFEILHLSKIVELIKFCAIQSVKCSKRKQECFNSLSQRSFNLCPNATYGSAFLFSYD
jgi:hypothetical protein